MSPPGGPRWRPSGFLASSAGLHAAGALALALAPRGWPAVLATLVADHLAIVGGGVLPRARLLGANRTRLPAAAAGRREVALTFDDGPDPEVTPAILDRLDRHGARATFFCIGERATRHPDLVQEIAHRGHAVENHSLTHSPAFALFGPARLHREIERTQEILGALAGRRPVLFRAPAGIRGPFLDPVLHRCGLQLVSWTRRGFDTVSRDAARVGARLARGLAAGDILLLHDGGSARGRDGRPVAVAALERLLAALPAAGLRAAPVPALPGGQGAG